MATATARKPRTNVEALPQLETLPERVGIVETKVESIKEQIIDLKGDVKEMHDCLDQTRDRVLEQLDNMTEEYRSNATKYYEHAEELHKHQTAQHDELAGKISELEKIKAKYTMYAMAAMSFLVGAGLLGHKDLPALLKFLGL
jgi:chromosome segregation ATPase